MSEKSNFENLAAINVSDKIEKKNGLSYLSWAWAVDQLMRADPDANWEYPEPRMFADTMMVFCRVTAFGKTMQSHLPVMDHRNRPIANPDAFAVNTAMQRCLVKAIALHGLGLYIYAGEDLPTQEEDAFLKLPQDLQNFMLEKAMEVSQCVAEGDVNAAIQTIDGCQFDADQYEAFWFKLDSKQRSTIKAGQAMLRAATLDELKKAWEGAPKHAHGALNSLKDYKKSELEKINE